ncbi:MAG: imidazole glycerol phosphate synthase subunit HisH [Ktedonobacterales bacterium]|nr:imidazole glycerol phosphate synthase subunit HisH [Ktedonobacterales bacterium]
MTVAIIDYGAGNLLSLSRALAAVDVPAGLITTPGELATDDVIVLPGVGAAGAAMAALSERGFAARLRATSQPILGICLGMQLLCDWLDEGDCAGLGRVPGKVKRILATPDRKVPQMGWNRITWGAECKLADDGFAGYFVHSYSCEMPLPNAHVGWTDYGGMPLCAAVHVPGIVGVQFHPEKSGPAGLALLRRAVQWLSEEGRG